MNRPHSAESFSAPNSPDTVIVLNDGPEVEVVSFEKAPKPKTSLDVSRNEGVLPLSSEAFLKKYNDRLFDYEKIELMSGIYPEVYYAADIINRDPLNPAEKIQTAEFDDTDGYYKFMLHDHLQYRYEVQKMLGKGSFAQVVSVLDHATGLSYALKMNRNTEIDHKFAEQEAKLLKFIIEEDPKDEHNIVRMLEHSSFR